MNEKRPHHDHVKVCITIVDCPTQLAIVMRFITNIKRNTAGLSATVKCFSQDGEEEALDQFVEEEMRLAESEF